MKNLFLFFAFFCFLPFSSQKKDYLKVIDSINKKRQDSIALDLDSLANPKLVDFNPHFKDSSVIKSEVFTPILTQEIPLTPYNILKQITPQKWFFFGQNNLVFNQSSFSNWNTGGNNNIGVLGKINYNLSYKNRKHFMENILQLGYGFVSSTGQSTRKTEDFINLTSNYGYDLGRNYYLSTGFQFISQFTPGYNYDLTPNAAYNDRVSKFMSPGYLNLGLGISYNPSENFQVIFRPINGKFTFVTDPLLQKIGKYGLEIDGQSVRSELGAMLNILYRLKIYKDINLVNQVNFFSNYLYHSERVDASYSGVLNIRFNKFISTVVSLDLLYDHDQIQKLQMKETLGIGFSYNLGVQNDDKEVRKKTVKPFITN